MWLRDFLPTQLPDSRIMTYGYGSALFSSGAVGTIADFSNQLLVSIDEKRTEEVGLHPLPPQARYIETELFLFSGEKEANNFYLS